MKLFKPSIFLVALLSLVLLLGVAAQSSVGAGPLVGGRTESEVVIYTSVDQVFSEPILEEFERSSGIRVRTLFDTEETKSTGVVNRLIAEASNPRADVFWSGDPVRPFLLMRRGLVERYAPPGASSVPAAFRSTDDSWTALASRARVLLVNRKRVDAPSIPRSVLDLVAPRWKDQTAIANPLFGTTTMHVAALFDAWGDAKAREFFEQLKANGVRVAGSNGEVKRLVVSGEVAFGLLDTDDAHEALAEKAPVEVVFPDQADLGTLLMPTAAVLLRGGPHPEAGRKLIDFLASAEVERRLAETAAHIPIRSNVASPANMPRLPDLRLMKTDYARLGLTMERLQPWLREWVGF